MPVAPPCVRTEIAMCDYDNEDHPARVGTELYTFVFIMFTLTTLTPSIT